tara:strand:- start:3 stop:1631 length:1629 start_codon:yes stop_codon:yes gene_type:complete
MFSQLFEERDRTISLLVKLGDCIGRSLRENTTLFSIDSHNSTVTYLTETDKVISGNYSTEKDVILDNIKIQESSVFADGDIFDNFINEKIHNFVEGIYYGEYTSAENSFSDVLSLWENRLKLDSLQQKLQEKTHKLEKLEKILESEEFYKLEEVTPQVVTFLQENYEKIMSVPEIKNAVTLANAVSNAFNFPRLSYEELLENKSYILKDGTSSSIYEMICRQELVKKELIESKKEFDTIWATNSNVRKLASMIFESDEKIVHSLAESLREIPYLALASKKSLFNTFKNCLSNVDGIGVDDKDIQQYASKIFEVKKEVKEQLIDTINEKYGVNIQNIQEPASFKSLINTQIVIFEALSRLTSSGSILKQLFSEMGSSLKGKSGVECIDLNEYVYNVFSQAGYVDILEEATKTSSKVDFKRISKDLGGAKELIDSLKDTVAANTDQEYPSDENVNKTAMAAGEKGGKAAEAKVAAAKGDKDLAKAASTEASQKDSPEEGEEEDTPPMPEEPVPEDEAISSLSDLENMVDDIAAELGMGDKKEKE